MTIAGSDSGGGAGIQADLKTISALGAFGVCALTAVTAQNTVGVQGIHLIPPEIVAQQIDSVVSDIGVHAAKTGMLATAKIITVVAERVRTHGIQRLVVDPVMVAKSGDRLLAEEAERALRTDLLPLALVVTPNLHEAARLAGFEVTNEASMQDAARAIHEMGPLYVYVKGGHLQGNALDLLYDGRTFQPFTAPRVNQRHTHGTGCILSAALAAEIALGREVPEAAGRAKQFVTQAIRHGIPLGRGVGPANPMHAASPE